MDASAEKTIPSPPPPPPASAPSYFNPISPFFNAYDRFSSWRKDLGLPHPGSIENAQKEVKATHLSNYTFDGARADMTKTFSMNPLFQVTHSFALGSQTSPPSYNFGAIFATPEVFLQGGVDHEGSVSARLNRGWSPNNVSKAQAQLSQQVGHNMIHLEHEYQGADFTANIKAMNPNPVDTTGIYIGSYLQSFTKNLALGVESYWQRPQPGISEVATAYLAKYTSNDKNWIATGQVQPAGIANLTYWQKLSERVEVAADLQVIANQERRDAIATIGAKYDLRTATFRTQLDSSGKISALLEQRFTPMFAFLVAGEIDHFKNAAKVGVGVMIEGSSLTPEEMGMTPEMH